MVTGSASTRPTVQPMHQHDMVGPRIPNFIVGTMAAPQTETGTKHRKKQEKRRNKKQQTPLISTNKKKTQTNTETTRTKHRQQTKTRKHIQPKPTKTSKNKKQTQTKTWKNTRVPLDLAKSEPVERIGMNAYGWHLSIPTSGDARFLLYSNSSLAKL